MSVFREQVKDIIDEDNKKVIEIPDYYTLRRALIEHPFGTLKDNEVVPLP